MKIVKKFFLVIFIIFILLLTILVFWLLMNSNSGSQTYSEGNSRQKMSVLSGTIYAFRDNPYREYSILGCTVRVTEEQFRRMAFFRSPEQAETAGFKPAEHYFESVGTCIEKGRGAGPIY